MMLHTITRKDLLDLVYRCKEEFLASIRRGDVYIVRSYYGERRYWPSINSLEELATRQNRPGTRVWMGVLITIVSMTSIQNLKPGPGCTPITLIAGI